jgi:hypothetical protein
MNAKLEIFLSRFPFLWASVALIGLIIGLIFGIKIGVISFMAITVLIIVFVWMRQLYWWITSTGDYKYIKKK